MEKKALALKRMIEKHSPKKENLDPRKWIRPETVRGFSDFALNKHSNKETDNSFDDVEMCEYARTANDKEEKKKRKKNKQAFCALYDRKDIESVVNVADSRTEHLTF